MEYGDNISRRAAIEAVNSLTYPSSLMDVKRKLIELPPAEPKQRTGKCMWCERLKERNLRIEYYWIDEEGCTASFSEPHIVATGIAKFCPNCGADMRGEQDG